MSPSPTTYVIVRRAFSAYTVACEDAGTAWGPATLEAMRLQAANRDGEYFVRPAGQPLRPEPSPAFQSAMDWL